MMLKWNKYEVGNILICGTEIIKNENKITIVLTHSESNGEDEYNGLVSMEKGSRGNELFNHRFFVHGWTDEEIFTKAENEAMKVLGVERKKYNDAINMLIEARRFA